MASHGTIDPKEAAHFGALAADWWDPKGSSAMLHRLNPVRLKYLREQKARSKRAARGNPGLGPGLRRGTILRRASR